MCVAPFDAARARAPSGPVKVLHGLDGPPAVAAFVPLGDT